MDFNNLEVVEDGNVFNIYIRYFNARGFLKALTTSLAAHVEHPISEQKAFILPIIFSF